MSTTQSTTTAPPTTNPPAIDVHYIRQVVTDWWARPEFDRCPFRVDRHGIGMCVSMGDTATLTAGASLLDDLVVRVDEKQHPDITDTWMVWVSGTYRGTKMELYGAFSQPDAVRATLTAQAGER